MATETPDLSQQEAELESLSRCLINDSLLAATDEFLMYLYADTSIPVLYKDSVFAESRREIVYNLIPKLVQTLKETNSFSYQFRDLRSMSIQTPPDSSFRIFTFALKEARGIYRHFGAIQMNSEDLHLFPLLDFSDTLELRTQEILSNRNWIGAVYYRILQHDYAGKTYYTLFGFDQNDLWSRIKMIEILSFDNNGSPVFGAPIIQKKIDDEVQVQNRFYLEYKKTAQVNLNYFEDMKLIIFDHTEPIQEDTEGLHFTYIPDGTYEAFRWDEKIGKWSWIEKVFHYAINENDNPPMPAPILDDRD